MGNDRGDSGKAKHTRAKRHNLLLPYLANTPLGNKVRERIEDEGYVVLRGILTPEECRVELDRLWDFVEATAPGVLRDVPDSWYPNSGSGDNVSGRGGGGDDNSDDPWPHSGWKFLPDMCQSFQAGWLFNSLRETLADRVFTPLYGTNELHSSKEGFTYHRPTAPPDASPHKIHPVLHSSYSRPRVCGKVQIRAQGEHFDQCAADTGLHCIQTSTALIDQSDDDGCFMCWPGSHVEHPNITSGIWRGRSDWVPLTDAELNGLEALGMEPKRVPVNAGDVILWRSDLVHCGVGPSSPTSGFRAVSYTCMLPAAMTPPDVLEGKLEEYINMQTGDHRPNVKSQHFANPKKEKEKAKGKKGNKSKEEDERIKVARGQYYDDGPPRLTLRQSELYGLKEYGEEGKVRNGVRLI